MEYNRRKYHNVPACRTVNGREIKFDSKREASRYDDLMLLLRAGKIRSLKLQPEYTVQEAFTTPEGDRVRAVRYRADFAYEKLERNRYEDYDGPEYIDEWVPVIEDVKGVRTRPYLLKKKMMAEKGYTVREV